MHELRPITVAEMEAQASPLLAAHWDEVEGKGSLSVNWDRYRELEGLGLWLGQGAYIGDTLVGYCSLTLGLHLHDRDAKPAKIDALYVAPAHRKGRIGLDLVTWALLTAAELGATEIAAHGRRGSPACRLYELLGFDERETVYVKGVSNGVRA